MYSLCRYTLATKNVDGHPLAASVAKVQPCGPQARLRGTGAIMKHQFHPYMNAFFNNRSIYCT